MTPKATAAALLFGYGLVGVQAAVIKSRANPKVTIDYKEVSTL